MSITKFEVIDLILGSKQNHLPLDQTVTTFAPANIALCKYWGKRNVELNLPMTSSLSISLDDKGTTTELKKSNSSEDIVILNDKPLAQDSAFCQRLNQYLALFRQKKYSPLHINVKTNIPIASGLASSASGFASLIQALNQLFTWELDAQSLSLLARLGSGSAARSLWHGFVEWHVGKEADGLDSYAQKLCTIWSDLCIGLLILSNEQKAISSREAMQRTVNTSPFYSLWPAIVAADLKKIKEAILIKNFDLLGKTAEANALAMHASMLNADPPILYSMPQTLEAMQKIWNLRKENLELYFTQDAGPNLKLLFLKKDATFIKSHFPSLEIVQPFGNSSPLP